MQSKGNLGIHISKLISVMIIEKIVDNRGDEEQISSRKACL